MTDSQEPRRDGDGGMLEEREQIYRNLDVSHRAALAGGSLGMVVNFVTGDVTGGTILLIGLILVLGARVALLRGRLRLAALVFQAALVGTIHALCASRDGVRDPGMVLYPLAILSAALALDRGLLVTVTAACITSVIILVRQGDPADWEIVLDIAIILVVAGVAVDLLMRGVLQKAAEARSKQQRLTEAYAELEARSAELERFTYVVSHDLKSPLVTIRGFLDYVEEDARAGDSERLGKDVERIRIAADRMGHLLDDVLELSRTGRISRPHEDVVFGEVVSEARAVVSGALAAAGVRVDVEPAAAEAVVRGDRARLVELVQNLLDNAVKFTVAGRTPEIRIGVREDPGRSRVFTVADNGIGIGSAHLERIFDLFHQLDPRGEGTGLGLALVRRIVETHRGRIWAESEGRGRGTTFCFTLPPGKGEG